MRRANQHGTELPLSPASLEAFMTPSAPQRLAPGPELIVLFITGRPEARPLYWFPPDTLSQIMGATRAIYPNASAWSCVSLLAKSAQDTIKGGEGAWYDLPGDKDSHIVGMRIPRGAQAQAQAWAQSLPFPPLLLDPAWPTSLHAAMAHVDGDPAVRAQLESLRLKALLERDSSQPNANPARARL